MTLFGEKLLDRNRLADAVDFMKKERICIVCKQFLNTKLIFKDAWSIIKIYFRITSDLPKRKYPVPRKLSEQKQQPRQRLSSKEQQIRGLEKESK